MARPRKTINELCDNSLVKRVKADGCNESFKEILNRHEKLFYKICQNYMSILENKGHKRDEVLSDLSFVVFKAVKTYKINKKTKFSTWIGNCSKYYCLTLINSKNRFIDADEETIKYYIDNQSKDNFDSKESNIENKEFIFQILKKLKDPRIPKVFQLRYFDKDKKNKKPTWSVIAKKINTSTQTAINLHQRGIEILGKKIKSKNHSDTI
jgi:RNA polymerase sigma factor (sigma-70 family)